jgi:hypothetical protein
MLVCLALISASCTDERGPGDGGSAFATSVSAPSPSPTTAPFLEPADGPPPSPTPPAIPERPPPTLGRVTRSCVGGWITPDVGTPLFSDPIGVIRRTARFSGDYVVVDMRYFVGPESPPSESKGYLQDIERWYVKLYAPGDPGYQGRFLVEARRFGRGLSAVAPYDTSGFSSPDWVGFQWEAADTTPKRYDGLPGKWRGVPYDFVRGGAGLTIAGLPDEVVGCMDGT